jgi:hypothetical protein
MRATLLVGLAVGLVAVAAPTAAEAAIQLGETFTPQGGCGPDTTFLQTGSPSVAYTAPSAGVITSWSYQATTSAPPVKLKIGRSAGGNNFTIIGESDLKNPVPNQLNTYTDVRISIQAGDILGMYVGPVMLPPCGRFASNFTDHYRSEDVPPGTTAEFTPEGSAQYDISAILEPDCDSDGFGDETQDASISSCHPRTLVLDATKNRVKKGKKVTLSGQVVETRQVGACAAGQAVVLQRRKPGQSFILVEHLQTDAAGGFTTKQKVKKTFEYRAQATETATCGGGVSNTEKVKVKKKNSLAS